MCAATKIQSPVLKSYIYPEMLLEAMNGTMILETAHMQICTKISPEGNAASPALFFVVSPVIIAKPAPPSTITSRTLIWIMAP